LIQEVQSIPPLFVFFLYL
jgi:hypothetical protein